jgi:hypothetical protein
MIKISWANFNISIIQVENIRRRKSHIETTDDKWEHDHYRKIPEKDLNLFWSHNLIYRKAKFNTTRRKNNIFPSSTRIVDEGPLIDY